MSTAVTISTLAFVGDQITIYLGTFILIAGISGGFLIVVVFLSLRTFRQNSCAFYITIMSIVNIGQLATGLLSRIVVTSYGIDWTLSSVFYCKCRLYFHQVCALTSMTCICLATIDQYLATGFHHQWQHWCNIKLACRLSAIFALIWIIHNIPYLIYYNHVLSITTGKMTCIITNDIFQNYTTYGIIIILNKILPICITCFFGSLAYRNVRRLARRTLPVFRHELDKQLTAMVLVQVASGLFTLLPNAIIYPLTMIPTLMDDPLIRAQLQFGIALTICLVYAYFAIPFYIFLFVSNRFRRQLVYVLFHVDLRRWRQRRIGVNQVTRESL